MQNVEHRLVKYEHISFDTRYTSCLQTLNKSAVEHTFVTLHALKTALVLGKMPEIDCSSYEKQLIEENMYEMFHLIFTVPRKSITKFYVSASFLDVDLTFA